MKKVLITTAIFLFGCAELFCRRRYVAAAASWTDRFIMIWLKKD